MRTKFGKINETFPCAKKITLILCFSIELIKKILYNKTKLRRCDKGILFMKILTVGKNEAELRLDSFLAKLFSKAPKTLIYKWIRKKRVKINGKKQDISYRLKEGDELFLYINDEFFEETPKKTLPKTGCEDIKKAVVFEDENLLIVNKPKGLSAHGGKGEANGGLVEEIRAYLFEKGEYDPKKELVFAPQLCHRIDKNTSGLVIAAKNAEALRIINEKIKKREIKKFYLLRVEGTLEKNEGEIRGYTKKDEKTNKVRFSFVPFDGAKEAVTLYKVQKNGYIEAELKTGRGHQIRASFAAIGHPLEGDVKYGAKKNGKKDYQNLLAYKIVFDFKTESGKLSYLKGKTVEIEIS